MALTQRWQPFALQPTHIALVITWQIILVGALSALLATSIHYKGLCVINLSNKYQHYLWTTLPTLLSTLTVHWFDMLYTNAKLLQPYRNLQKGANRDDSLALPSPPVSALMLLPAWRKGYNALAFFCLLGVLGLVFDPWVSGLLAARNYPKDIAINIAYNYTIGPGFVPGNDESQIFAESVSLATAWGYRSGRVILPAYVSSQWSIAPLILLSSLSQLNINPSNATNPVVLSARNWFGIQSLPSCQSGYFSAASASANDTSLIATITSDDGRCIYNITTIDRNSLAFSADTAICSDEGSKSPSQKTVAAAILYPPGLATDPSMGFTVFCTPNVTARSVDVDIDASSGNVISVTDRGPLSLEQLQYFDPTNMSETLPNTAWNGFIIDTGPDPNPNSTDVQLATSTNSAFIAFLQVQWLYYLADAPNFTPDVETQLFDTFSDFYAIYLNTFASGTYYNQSLTTLYPPPSLSSFTIEGYTTRLAVSEVACSILIGLLALQVICTIIGAVHHRYDGWPAISTDPANLITPMRLIATSEWQEAFDDGAVTFKLEEGVGRLIIAKDTDEEKVEEEGKLVGGGHEEQTHESGQLGETHESEEEEVGEEIHSPSGS